MLSLVGNQLVGALTSAGRATILLGKTGRALVHVGRSRRLLFQQMDMAGFGSLLVLALIAGLTGMIMAMQMGPALEDYNAIDTLGGIIGLTFCRELGPIWAAVIVLARVGSAMAAQIGTMVVNEEVDALEVMSVDPVRYLVLPRILGLILVMPFLTALANVVGLAGGALVASSLFGVPVESFLDSAQRVVELSDFGSGLVKSVVFGAVIGAIACDQGLSTRGGAEGVGLATTNAVRLSVIFVLVCDLILTALLRLILPMGGL